MKTIAWRLTGANMSGVWGLTHILNRADHTYCGKSVPEMADITEEGIAACRYCRDRAHAGLFRTRRRFLPTQEEVAAAVTRYIKEGGEVLHLPDAPTPPRPVRQMYTALEELL